MWPARGRPSFPNYFGLGILRVCPLHENSRLSGIDQKPDFWPGIVPIASSGALPETVRALIFQMLVENPTWGVPRIHGELLKLGFDLSERSLSRWIRRGFDP